MTRVWYQHPSGLLFPGVAGGEPVAIPSIFGQKQQTNVTAAARDGTTVTASATIHTMGAWASLIDPTNFPSYGFCLTVGAVGVSAANRSTLMNIGFGITGGGGTIQTLVPFLDVGAAATSSDSVMGRNYFFPVYIPTGVRVQAQAQAAVASQTMTVVITLLQRPLFPFVAARWKSYGENTAASHGTSVTPASGSFGTWTQVPAATTTTRAHNLWHIGYSLGTDTTVVTTGVLVELGRSISGGGTGDVKSIGLWRLYQTSTELIYGPSMPMPVYYPVPSSQQLWIRIASGEAEARRAMIYAGDALAA